MATELNETSTKEEVDAFVDNVIKEVKQETSEGLKDDARITSEHADNEKTPTTDAEPVVEDTAPEGEETGWINDDLKAEVAAYGIDEAELAEFANREELDRALRLFDKTALEAGRKAMAEDEPTERTRNEKGQFEKQEAPDSDYKVELDPDIYDEAIVGEFNKLRDRFESRLQELETRFLEVDAKAEERHFDMLVDAMGHKDLFGATGKENDKQLQRRKDLMVAVKAQQIGLEQLGRPAEMDESLVSRVARMVFSEDLSKKDLKAKTQKMFKQHNSRMGGGATRPQDPREDPRDEFDRLYKQLEGR